MIAPCLTSEILLICLLIEFLDASLNLFLNYKVIFFSGRFDRSSLVTGIRFADERLSLLLYLKGLESPWVFNLAISLLLLRLLMTWVLENKDYC